MIAKRPTLFALVLLAASSAWAQRPGDLVEAYISAYNAHDVEAALDLVDPDIEWLTIDGADIQVQTAGAEAFEEALRGYFEAVPEARSEVESMMVAGRRVSVHERAFWNANGEERSQAALSVYEIADGRIVRVWYFPAE